MPLRTLTDLRAAFVWDESALRYRSAATGRFISDRAIKQAVNTVVARSQREIRGIAADMAGGRMDIGDFQARLRDELKNLHLTTAAAAKGGWQQMTQADFGRVGAELRFQYERLELFARHAEAGDLSEKQITARAELYVGAANGTFEGTRKADAEAAGREEVRNILGQAEHCSECLEETAKGFVPIAEMSTPGSRICRANCRCSLEFR